MIINQFHSIGDIIFIEPICRKIWENTGKKPTLPIRDHLMWLAEYIESADLIPMSKSNLDFNSLAITYPEYLPLRFANQIINNHDVDYHDDYENCMPDKYKLVNLLLPYTIPLDEWTTINLKFNEDKGAELYNKLDLGHNEYALVNEHCQIGDIKIPTEQIPYKIVYMNEIKGYTLIDWFMVMINAKEIHTVSTSLFYLLQAIKNKYEFNQPCYIYPRPNHDGLRGISKLKPTFNCILK